MILHGKEITKDDLLVYIGDYSGKLREQMIKKGFLDKKDIKTERDIRIVEAILDDYLILNDYTGKIQRGYWKSNQSITFNRMYVFLRNINPKKLLMDKILHK